MAVNEVVVNGVKELSLVNDTVSEDTLLEGATAHDASGKQITGKLVVTPVDSELNAESENAIQNKAVVAGINNAVNGVKEYANGIISNPNLLDNPDFSINQRGQSVYDGTVAGIYKYAVDRWCFWKYNSDNYGTITVNPDGSLSVDGVDGANDCILTQTVENGMKLVDKTVTLSLEITEITGTVQLQLHKSSASIHINKPGVYQLTFVWPELDVYRICINNTDSSRYTIKWMKLEVGPVATAFVPPNPATELAKCKWYYRRIEQARIRAWGYTANSILFFISYPEMRVRPTATIKGSPTISNMEIASYNDFTCSVDWALPTGCRITAAKTAHGLTDGILHINSDSNAYIELSADL